MAFGEPMYVPLPLTECPAGICNALSVVLEKNTFLEFVDAPPPSFDIRRAETEPVRKPIEAEVWHDCVETPWSRESRPVGAPSMLRGWIENGDVSVDTPPDLLIPSSLDLERFETPPGLLELSRYESPPGLIELERFESPPGLLDFQRYESYDWLDRPLQINLVDALPAMPTTIPDTVGYTHDRDAAACLAGAPTTQMSSEATGMISHSTFDILRPFMAFASPPPPPANPAPVIKERPMPAVPSASPRDVTMHESSGVSSREVERPVEGDNSRAASVLFGDNLRPNVVTSSSARCGRQRISWAADAKKLESWDKQLVSPQFSIDIPEHGEHMFKMVLYPMVVNDGKHGAAFKKARGRGRVVLKCDSELPDTFPLLSFHISIGNGDNLQPARGPVTHNFTEQSCGGLRKDEEEWHFASVVCGSRTFVVSLEIASFQAIDSSYGVGGA